jgi:hypothetical protein
MADGRTDDGAARSHSGAEPICFEEREMSFGWLGSVIVVVTLVVSIAALAWFQRRERRRRDVFEAEFATMRAEMRRLEERGDAASTAPAIASLHAVPRAALSDPLRAALAGR